MDEETYCPVCDATGTIACMGFEDPYQCCVCGHTVKPHEICYATRYTMDDLPAVGDRIVLVHDMFTPYYERNGRGYNPELEAALPKAGAWATVVLAHFEGGCVEVCAEFDEAIPEFEEWSNNLQWYEAIDNCGWSGPAMMFYMVRRVRRTATAYGE